MRRDFRKSCLFFNLITNRHHNKCVKKSFLVIMLFLKERSEEKFIILESPANCLVFLEREYQRIVELFYVEFVCRENSSTFFCQSQFVFLALGITFSLWRSSKHIF